MQDFLPWHGFFGGVLIGTSAALFLLLSGRISGISGILENILTPRGPDFGCSIAYLVGLPLGAVAVGALAPHLLPSVSLTGTWPLLVVAGLLVGFGTRMSGGCTSGHGVCGLPRFSTRGIVATAVFMLVTAITVFIIRHVV